ncbi:MULTISPECIES: YfhE family protein [Alkalihalobacterium]|uniref:YfhE family protein n=1 Tax=Alkalihalobacterium chitinilyticum TaxID=2980103 RepID=A0ABT5VHG1_9BACI|nr:YfhE family protein [Alkalihalobacterium chitinilyticum]MDE5414849.1 YfhE family protein [Alkalihalobacterium chitinilyticum]MEB1805820.1 YfhE family protein [Bacillaceae bacterium]
MEKKKRRDQQERHTLKKAQQVTYQSDFKAADRAARR